jgi:hypothetical protein
MCTSRDVADPKVPGTASSNYGLVYNSSAHFSIVNMLNTKNVNYVSGWLISDQLPDLLIDFCSRSFADKTLV